MGTIHYDLEYILRGPVLGTFIGTIVRVIILMVGTCEMSPLWEDLFSTWASFPDLQHGIFLKCSIRQGTKQQSVSHLQKPTQSSKVPIMRISNHLQMVSIPYCSCFLFMHRKPNNKIRQINFSWWQRSTLIIAPQSQIISRKESKWLCSLHPSYGIKSRAQIAWHEGKQSPDLNTRFSSCNVCKMSPGWLPGGGIILSSYWWLFKTAHWLLSSTRFPNLNLQASAAPLWTYYIAEGSYGIG